MGNSTSTRTHTRLKPVPVSTGTGIDGYGYGYSRVARVPKPGWVWTTGCTCIDAARRGQPSPSRQFTLVNAAGRVKPSPSRQFAFFNAAGRERPSPSRQFASTGVCVCDGVSNGGGEQLGRGGRGLELEYHVVFNLKTYLLWGWA